MRSGVDRVKVFVSHWVTAQPLLTQVTSFRLGLFQ